MFKGMGIPMNFENFITIAKALSDPNRVRVLLALRVGELCVCQIIELLDLAPSTVSKHMSILKQAGLVESRKDSRWIYFSFPDETNQDKGTSDMINKTINLLQTDNQITADSNKLEIIISDGIEEVCKRQRNVRDNK